MSGTTQKGEFPDFVLMRERFDKGLSNGQRAEIRRVRLPEDLEMIPAYYRLVVPVAKPDRRLERVVFFMPYVGQTLGGLDLGVQLALSEVSEQRLFQVVRSEQPQDLVYLRRLCQQVEPTVPWDRFGKMLYFWGDESKRRILEDYFMAEYAETKEEGEKGVNR